MTKRAIGPEIELAKGELQVIDVDGGRICLANYAGRFYALQNDCTHEGASLSEGEIYRGSVQCPMHGSLFDLRTGEVTGMPAMIPARAYPVTIEDGVVFVDV